MQFSTILLPPKAHTCRILKLQHVLGVNVQAILCMWDSAGFRPVTGIVMRAVSCGEHDSWNADA